jgi:hypothetical protein
VHTFSPMHSLRHDNYREVLVFTNEFRVMLFGSVAWFLASHERPAPYPSLTVRVPNGRVTNIHVNHLSSGDVGVPGTLARVCFSASVPALGRTRHPFAVSGSEKPSQKIEFVFSASPETIRREPRRMISFAQSATCRTWQSAHFVHPVSFGSIYAAAVLRSSAGVKSLCCRSTARR